MILPFKLKEITLGPRIPRGPITSYSRSKSIIRRRISKFGDIHKTTYPIKNSIVRYRMSSETLVKDKLYRIS